MNRLGLLAYQLIIGLLLSCEVFSAACLNFYMRTSTGLPRFAQLSSRN